MNVKKLMFVDDNPILGKVFTMSLRDDGYDVSLASNGEEALFMIDLGRPDLIILDIEMPGMDGFELCEKFKERPETSDIPVLFLSNSLTDEHINRSQKLGSIDCLSRRDCTPLNLSFKIRQLMSTYRDFNNKRQIIGKIPFPDQDIEVDIHIQAEKSQIDAVLTPEKSDYLEEKIDESELMEDNAGETEDIETVSEVSEEPLDRIEEEDEEDELVLAFTIDEIEKIRSLSDYIIMLKHQNKEAKKVANILLKAAVENENDRKKLLQNIETIQSEIKELTEKINSRDSSMPFSKIAKLTSDLQYKEEGLKKIQDSLAELEQLIHDKSRLASERMDEYQLIKVKLEESRENLFNLVREIRKKAENRSYFGDEDYIIEELNVPDYELGDECLKEERPDEIPDENHEKDKFKEESMESIAHILNHEDKPHKAEEIVEEESKSSANQKSIDQFLQNIEVKIKEEIKDSIHIPTIEEQAEKKNEEAKLQDVLFKNKEFFFKLFNRHRKAKNELSDIEADLQKLKGLYKNERADIKKWKNIFYENQKILKEKEDLFIKVRDDTKKQKQLIEESKVNNSPDIKNLEKDLMDLHKEYKLLKEDIKVYKVKLSESKNKFTHHKTEFENYKKEIDLLAEEEKIKKSYFIELDKQLIEVKALLGEFMH